MVATQQTNQVIALAVIQLCEVIKRGYFDIPETVEETTTQWFHDADLVLGWLEDGGLERHTIKKPTLRNMLAQCTMCPKTIDRDRDPLHAG